MDVLAALALVIATIAQAKQPTPVRAITKPSADVVLAFVQPGCVAEIACKEGDLVKPGQLLVRLDDSVEKAQYAQILAQTEDTTQIKASQASLEQRKVDLQRIEAAAQRKAATDLEVEHARLDVRIAELSLELAQFEHRQALLKLQEAQARLDRMRLLSPIEGRIEEVFVEKGEAVNALDKVIRVVDIDPLWIDASVPVPEAVGLSAGSRVTVEFPDPQAMIATGKVIFVAKVADAASLTMRVRIEVPNPTGRQAGEQVRVLCQQARIDQ
ncbi:MAG: efflux RND transporter periplasmic adaptor subunit [Sedimentisphaerales bacterium]|jgi:RND family efflux transporter MFP subunit|nr:efflux RND transporter periplasmic adaptor subunit [Sedimentisphaerales bacterium]